MTRLPLVATSIFSLCLLSVQAEPARHIRPSLKALDLERTPTTEELMAAGQLGGTLYPTEGTIAKRRKDGANRSFGRAIDAWNHHDYTDAVEMFRAHVDDHPDSPWAAEALLHIGCDATYKHRFSEAEMVLTEIIARHAGTTDFGTAMMLSKARSRLAQVKISQNNFEEARTLFRELILECPDWRLRTYASHWFQKLRRASAHQQALMSCGAHALAHVLGQQGRPQAAKVVARLVPETPEGFGVQDLVGLAADYDLTLAPVQLTVEELGQVELPVVLHVPPRNPGDGGHYWVLEDRTGDTLRLLDPQINKRFVQQKDELAREWAGTALVITSGDPAPGTPLAWNSLAELTGGCCGAPMPESGMGGPGPNGAGGGPWDPGVNTINARGTGCAGAPVWTVNMVNMNLYVHDVPIWFNNQAGPDVRVALSYNSQSAINHHEPFGNKWTFNYGSYLVEDPGNTVTLFMPDGRRDVFYLTDAMLYSNATLGVFNDLEKVGQNQFELTFPDDTVYRYGIPPGTGSLQPFLTEIRDRHGLSVTFTYNTNLEMTAISDPWGRQMTLTYVDGLCTRVDGPFGRHAAFTYDVDRNLTQITDMAGYFATFTYDADAYLTSIGNERGTWAVDIEPADGMAAAPDEYPAPGDVMWENYRITITDPLGGREEYFFYGGCEEGYGCDGFSWYIRPEHYVPYQSPAVNNLSSQPPKTRYLLSRALSIGSEQGKIARVVYPNGAEVHSEYDYDSGHLASVSNSQGHVWNYAYNVKGKITSETDPGGAVTAYHYDGTNNVNPTTISNALGAVRFTYNAAHDITGITDRQTNTLTLAYNSLGQLTNVVNALGTPRTYAYDVDHRLVQVREAGAPVRTLTYDAFDRIRTVTNARGFSYTNEYNDLNAITRLAYPDGSTIQYTFDSCCPRLVSAVTRPDGSEVAFVHDARQRLLEQRNPDGATTRWSYDLNGNVSRVQNANGRITTYTYDAEDRLVAETDPLGNTVAYDLDPFGLVRAITNATGTVISYAYDWAGRLTNTAHNGATVAAWTLDLHGNVSTHTHPLGTDSYTYDTRELVTAVAYRDGLVVSNTYDALRRPTSIAYPGGFSVDYHYDARSRLTNIVWSGGAVELDHDADHNLVRLAYAAGSENRFGHDGNDRYTNIVLQSSTGLIARFETTRDILGNVTNLQQTAPALPAYPAFAATHRSGQVDPANRMTTWGATTVQQDASGNVTNLTGGLTLQATYDPEDRMISLQRAGAVHAYTYDGYGNRIRAVRNGQVTNYHHSPGGRMLFETDGAGQLAAYNIYAGGLLIARGTPGAGFARYHYDGSGHVRALTDDVGEVDTAYTYLPFGALAAQDGTSANPYTYLGAAGVTREDSGLYFNGRRFYEAELGRYLQD